MSKPSPSRDHHGHQIVHLPDGGKIVPEHFHEGAGAARRFGETVRGVLTAPRAATAGKQAARTKQRRKAG
jgi:hypothetical protein